MKVSTPRTWNVNCWRQKRKTLQQNMTEIEIDKIELGVMYKLGTKKLELMKAK